MSIKPKLTLTIEIDPDKKEITYSGVSEIGTDIVKYSNKLNGGGNLMSVVFKDWIAHLEKYGSKFGC